MSYKLFLVSHWIASSLGSFFFHTGKLVWYIYHSSFACCPLLLCIHPLFINKLHPSFPVFSCFHDVDLQNVYEIYVYKVYEFATAFIKIGNFFYDLFMQNAWRRLFVADCSCTLLGYLVLLFSHAFCKGNCSFAYTFFIASCDFHS